MADAYHTSKILLNFLDRNNIQLTSCLINIKLPLAAKITRKVLIDMLYSSILCNIKFNVMWIHNITQVYMQLICSYCVYVVAHRLSMCSLKGLTFSKLYCGNAEI